MPSRAARAVISSVATRRWIPTTVVLVLVPVLTACGAPRDPVSGLVPTTWTMTAMSGHIATPCFGSWEECGTLKRTYDTHSAEQPAVEGVTQRLRDSGWTVERITHGQVVAFNARDLKSETARLNVDVSNGLASLSYVHQ